MILVIDNYDSFTYNLVQYLGQCRVDVRVWRNDEIGLNDVLAERPAGIMLSPGPCTPDQSGVCLDLARAALDGKTPPVFGVCLGHQAIGLVAGGTVRQAKTMMHGKASSVRHDGAGLFTGLPNPMRAIRYHSLVVDDLPPTLAVTARSEDDDEIMGFRHVSLPIEGVQFHPESILTEDGLRIVRNFVDRVANFAAR